MGAGAAALPLIRIRELSKSYQRGGQQIPVLLDIHLDVMAGDFIALMGPSGSGKSTLLNLIAGIDQPSSGRIEIGGVDIASLSEGQLADWRARNVGFIFQFYHLLPELTALENVLSPKMISDGVLKYWRNRREHRAEAERLLETVGLGHRLKHKPREMSGGEMQRAAIARALITKPEVLLADEPTGNLDRRTGQEILTLLRTLSDREKLTVVMVTHDLGIAEQADRVVSLVEGRVEH